MELIKENKQKKRQIWKSTDSYKKVWLFNDTHWLNWHVELLEKVVPGYVKGYGSSENNMWLIMDVIPGIPASQFPHTDEFIEKIYNFCLENIQSTKPYFHGDWVLSNILINGDEMKMCDWDNLNLYPESDVPIKLHKDLTSAFGSKFNIMKDRL